MTINPIGPNATNLQQSDLMLGKPVNPSSTLTTGQTPDATAISPAASLLNELSQLQQQNPSQFSQVLTQITDSLNHAAQTASTKGDTQKAAQLNLLATTFQNSATGGPLPTVQQLHRAGLGGHHHHGGHHYGGMRAPEPLTPIVQPSGSSPFTSVLNPTTPAQGS